MFLVLLFLFLLSVVVATADAVVVIVVLFRASGTIDCSRTGHLEKDFIPYHIKVLKLQPLGRFF